MGEYWEYTDNNWLNHGRSGKDKDKKKKPSDDPDPNPDPLPEGGPNRNNDSSFKKKIKEIIQSIPLTIEEENE